MKFTLQERFNLMGILPREGNILTARVLHDLRQKLAPSDREAEEFAIRADGQTVRWETEQAEGRCEACGVTAYDPKNAARPNCPKCGKPMLPTGEHRPLKKDKDIAIGADSLTRKVVVDALKDLSRRNKLDVANHWPLVEKFFSKADFEELEAELDEPEPEPAKDEVGDKRKAAAKAGKPKP